MLDELLERLARHDRLALSRLLSLAAQGTVGPAIAGRLPVAVRSARVVAFTGSGGVGKSSLIGKMIDTARSDQSTVAVLACDPESSLSGGALLGDRFRMGSRADDGVFIRSLAARSGQGALAEHLDLMCRILEAFGFGTIFIETVGAGQGDVAVRSLADVVVLLLQPETGDDLQWEKAGVLEIADIVVVHKADLPGAEHVANQVRAALDLSSARSVPILLVSAKNEEGLRDLWRDMQSCPLRRLPDADARNQLLRLAQDALAARFHEQRGDPELAKLVADWQGGTISAQKAVDALLKRIMSR